MISHEENPRILGLGLDGVRPHGSRELPAVSVADGHPRVSERHLRRTQKQQLPRRRRHQDPRGGGQKRVCRGRRLREPHRGVALRLWQRGLHHPLRRLHLGVCPPPKLQQGHHQVCDGLPVPQQELHGDHLPVERHLPDQSRRLSRTERQYGQLGRSALALRDSPYRQREARQPAVFRPSRD